MPQPFFATIAPAGYAQFPNLMVVTPLPGFSPGSPPARPTPGPLPPYVDNTLPPYIDNTLPGLPPYVDNTLPRPPLGIWGPTDPRPDHPIVLPPNTPVPPSWIGTLPPPGQPGSPGNPNAPGTPLPPHPSTGAGEFYLVLPYVGVWGPYTVPPAGVTPPPTEPEPPEAP